MDSSDTARIPVPRGDGHRTERPAATSTMAEAPARRHRDTTGRDGTSSVVHARSGRIGT